MRLVLSRVTSADFDAILPVQFEAFSTVDLATVFFGKGTPGNIAAAKKKLIEVFHNDPADLWLKIEDEDEEVEIAVVPDPDSIGDGDSGKWEKKKVKRLVSASNWKIYPTYVEPKAEPQKILDGHKETNETADVKISEADKITWLETEQQREDAIIITEDFMSRRRRACKEGHLLLFILYVDPTYQRQGGGKGVGSMMMQWGNELADQLMLPCWLEASPYGRGLYAKYGYEVVETVKLVTPSFVSEYTHMRRPAKVQRMHREGTELVKS